MTLIEKLQPLMDEYTLTVLKKEQAIKKYMEHPTIEMEKYINELEKTVDSVKEEMVEGIYNGNSERIKNALK